jgi:hypothetical protein
VNLRRLLKLVKILKSKRFITLFTLIIIFNIVTSTRVILGQEKFSIGDKSPLSNRKVETMKGILKVEVLSSNVPVPYAWVNFYIDEEWVGNDLTDLDGVASKTVDLLDELGYHTWKVRVNKEGYEKLWSPEWRFNYQPRPVLTLLSDYGETYGNDSYTYGETALFGVEPQIINIEDGKRLVFVEWVSFHENGYSGNENESNATMLNNILEIAVWKTQYYLDMSCELPKAVSPKSGWYDENIILGIRVDPPSGTEFLYWNGSGKDSYSGTEIPQSIRLYGPIQEEAIFERKNYELTVKSEYGNPWGSDVYPAWENVSFGIEDEYIDTNKGERVMFTGWGSDSKYGYNGNIKEYRIEIGEDILQEANWKKQYYVDLSSSTGGNVTPKSGWVDENSRIILEAKGEENYQFIGWSGVGDSVIKDSQNNYTVVITSPLNRTAQWKRICRVSMESELPVEGTGEYLEGDVVTIEAVKSEGLLVRKIFHKWTGDIDTTNTSFTFTIDRDMKISATYDRNYTYLLVIMVVLLILIWIPLYKMITNR